MNQKKEGPAATISKMAGESWSGEPNEVKCYYKILSKEALEDLEGLLFPNSKTPLFNYITLFISLLGHSPIMSKFNSCSYI